MTNCPCCEHRLNASFSGLVLDKYNAEYLLCPQCGFISIANPHWLNESYSDAITSIDVGLVQRNLELSKATARLLQALHLQKGPFLDWAGGYGLFTRLMRDRGFNFLHHDPYCKNLFAQLQSYSGESNFQLITAFEFLEHTPNPFLELESLFQKSDTILFSTVLLPIPSPLNNTEWWYFAPECGQHISFFTEETLKTLATRLNARYFHNGHSLHLLTKNPSISNPFPSFHRILDKWKAFITNRFSNNSSRPSLTDADYKTALVELRKLQAGTK